MSGPPIPLSATSLGLLREVWREQALGKCVSEDEYVTKERSERTRTVWRKHPPPRTLGVVTMPGVSAHPGSGLPAGLWPVTKSEWLSVFGASREVSDSDAISGSKPLTPRALHRLESPPLSLVLRLLEASMSQWRRE